MSVNPSSKTSLDPSRDLAAAGDASPDARPDGSRSAQAIRLTGTSFAVLSLIDGLGPSSPYDLKQALEKSIENFWPVPHTTFYAEPARLARGGFLSEQQEASGRRRKLYSLTDAGRRALREWTRSPDVSPPQLRDEGMLKIFAGADPAPILRRRLEWHRAKLAELEGYLQGVEAAGGPEGVRSSLLVGTGYHRMIIEALDNALAGQAASGSS
jgi:DNA-binding PadR family transcriptional regulator